MSDASLGNMMSGTADICNDIQKIIDWLESLKSYRVNKKAILKKLDILLNGEEEDYEDMRKNE